ncbi:MAG: class IV adenylate cyclase [Planctomycetota bacterium]|nr:class IV adenylate cyclase [Planctomycetota bacterium]
MNNVELKARTTDLNKAREVCEELSAEFMWRRNQRDIYFATTPDRRLKLRIEDNESPYLVRYSRPDKTGGRDCTYSILTIHRTCHAESVEFFTGALEVKGEVEKTRELFVWENVRIHLDRVKGLGEFIEFEHPVGEHGKEQADMRIQMLCERFSINTPDTVPGSYVDLLELE